MNCTPESPHEFWQVLNPPGSLSRHGPFRDFYVAELPDGRQLALPIRPLAGGELALASLIINQASFAVQEALAAALLVSRRAFRAAVFDHHARTA